MELKLEVGNSYRTRGGWKATVVWDKCEEPYSVLAIHHVDAGDHSMAHEPNGETINTVNKAYYLIAPWIDAPKEGSDAWANALPVGTRITHKNWASSSYLTRCENGWKHLSSVAWVNALPAPDGWLLHTRPIITDWPKWAKAAVKSYNGVWYWCDFIPSVQGYGWTCDDKCNFYQIHPSEVPDWKGDWKDSLVVREEANG